MSDSVTTAPPGLSRPREMLLEQQYYTLTALGQINAGLDGKLASLLQGAGVLSVLTAVGAYFPRTGVPLAPAQVCWVVIALVMLACMVVVSAWGWVPKSYILPGENDLEFFEQHYFGDNVDQAFTDALAQCMKSLARARDVNHTKTVALRIGAALLVAQVFILVLVIGIQVGQ